MYHKANTTPYATQSALQPKQNNWFYSYRCCVLLSTS